MPTKSKAYLAALALVLPLTANAAPVTLNFSGVFTSVADPASELTGLGIAPGGTFNFILKYDSAAALIGTSPGTTGTAAAYSGASLQMQIIFGASCGVADNCGPDANTAASVMFVDNDFTNPGFPVAVDALGFVFVDSSHHRWTVGLGTNDLSVFSGTSLPSSLDSRFSTGGLRVCSIAIPPNPNSVGAPCLDDKFQVSGDMRISSVPEPTTLALLGFALAGLGMAQRRLRS